MSEKQPNVDYLETPYDPRLSAEENGVNAQVLEFNLPGLQQHPRRTLGAAGMRAIQREAAPSYDADTDIAA